MPNQLNYPQKLTSTDLQRPSRYTASDQKLLGLDTQQVIFGTTTRDVVELWIYNPDGTFASHMNLGYADPALSVATLVDSNGTTQVINIDLKDVGNRMAIQPGRYAMVANFFRDEVGSEAGAKLYISEISPSRTELKLTPVAVDAAMQKAMFEFLVPSVPILYAKGLMDEAFGLAVQSDPMKRIQALLLLPELDAFDPGTADRLYAPGLAGPFLWLIQETLLRTYSQALISMAIDAANQQVQYVELESYVEKALDAVIYTMKQRGEIDPRFELV